MCCGRPRWAAARPRGRYPLGLLVNGLRTPEGGGRLGPAVNTIMLFEKGKPARGWTLNGTAALDRPLPPVAVGSDGYAVAAPLTDGSVLLRPDVLGATQAAVADEGPAA